MAGERGAAVAASAGHGPARTSDDMVPARHVVTARRHAATGTVTLVLEPLDEPLDDPAPGQFSMLYGFGTGEAAISASATRRDDGAVAHTVREAGPGTRALCRARPGSVVGVRGPFGRGWPMDALAGRDVVIVAGGIGLAPLRPVVRRLLAGRLTGERTLTVVVGARTPRDVLFADELQTWAARPGVRLATTVDIPDHGWRGDVGLVTEPLRRMVRDLDPRRAVALVCGPEVMMRAVARTLRAGDIPAEHIAVSLERNMVCAVRRCGHCQLGPLFVCTDGPVLWWTTAAPLLSVRRW